MGWGRLLGEIAAVVGDKILSRHADAIAKFEHELLDEESRPYDDQDDLKIQDLRSRIIIERNAYEAQFKLRGGK